MSDEMDYKGYVIVRRVNFAIDGLTVQGETLHAYAAASFLIRVVVERPGLPAIEGVRREVPATSSRHCPLPYDWAFKSEAQAQEAIDILIEHGENGFWLEYARRRVAEAGGAWMTTDAAGQQQVVGDAEFRETFEPVEESDEVARSRRLSRRLFEFDAGLGEQRYVLKRWEAGAGPQGWKTVFGPSQYALAAQALREETERLEGEGYESSSDERDEVEFRESSSAQRPSIILKIEEGGAQ